MKKYFLLILFFIYGCRTYDQQSIANRYSYDTSKLSEHYHIYDVADKKNAIVSCKEKKCYTVEIKQYSSAYPTHTISDLLFIATLGASTLIGVPASTQRGVCEIHASILSKNKNPIKSIHAEAEDYEYEAMYYGYNELDAKKTAQYSACIKAIKNLFEQLEEIPFEEIKNLNKEDGIKIEKEQLEQKKKKEKTEAEKQKKAQERMKYLTEKYGKETADAIIKHQLIRGMSESALIESWGNPLRIISSVDKWGTHKEYIYWNLYMNDSVYVENGIVESWQISR